MIVMIIIRDPAENLHRTMFMFKSQQTRECVVDFIWWIFSTFIVCWLC